MPDKKFIDECLSAHNVYRKKHRVGALKHNPKLTDIAQGWADHLAGRNAFQHSTNKIDGQKLGENIAMKWTSSGQDFTGQQATDQWYSEIKDYDFSGNSNISKTGHFTQVVWKGSNEFGVGKAQTKDGKWLVVANYHPAGNFLGRFNENVLTPDGPIEVPSQKAQPSAGTGGPSAAAPMSQSSGGGGGGSKTVETKEIREGNTVRTIVTETTITPSGQKRVSTRETIKTIGGSSGAAGNDLQDRFGKMSAGGQSKPPQPKQSPKEFIDDAVRAHNELRRKHNTGDVKHNPELSKIAQDWADHLAATGSFQHSTNTYKGNKLGENIANKWSSSGTDYTGEEAVQQWYSEISKYDFNRATFTSGTGHFTQVVWKGSKEIGMGKATGRDGRVFVVANYLPAGNMMGDFAQNVLPLR